MTDSKSYLGWKIDFANPPGEPALVAPDSVQWRVFKNPVALGVGGVAAVLMEFADARIRSGVWDHSTYKHDPLGRSQRTGVAAMVGVYGPQSAARRVIQGVNNMHRRVAGQTPDGESYQALDTELLDWVSATAGYGFLKAYDRFVARLSPEDKRRYFTEGAPIARLYGVTATLRSEADFLAMMQKLSHRFEPHPIVREFLGIIESGRAAPGVPRFLHRALARAAVSILPPPAREKLELGAEYDLSPLEAMMVRAMAVLAERIPVKGSPPTEAAMRLGLPWDFLYRKPADRQRLLADAPTAPAPSRAAS